MIEYTWSAATGNDVQPIVDMAEANFQIEIDKIFTPEPITYARNIMFAVVNQFYLPTSELISVAKTPEGKLLGYTWAKNGDRTAWSDDIMVSVRMAHVDLELSPRVRIQLLKDMLRIWENFAHYAGTSVICSTTMRGERDTFLKLHARYGYDVRGSYAYKKLQSQPTAPVEGAPV